MRRCLLLSPPSRHGTGSAPGAQRGWRLPVDSRLSQLARRTGAPCGLRPEARLFGPGREALPQSSEPRRWSDHPPWAATPTISQRPQIRRDDPLNLSILLSGGKETNKDSPSSGERRGKSPAPNPRPRRAREMWRTGDGRRPGADGGLSPSDRGSARGRCEAGSGPRCPGAPSPRSRVVCECSPKLVVNSI